MVRNRQDQEFSPTDRLLQYPASPTSSEGTLYFFWRSFASVLRGPRRPRLTGRSPSLWPADFESKIYSTASCSSSLILLYLLPQCHLGSVFRNPHTPPPKAQRVSERGGAEGPPGLDDSINTSTELEVNCSIGGEETVNSVDGAEEVTHKQCSESHLPRHPKGTRGRRRRGTP